MKLSNSLARYALLNDLDEALVAECLPPTLGGVVPAAVAEAIATEVVAANAEAAATAQAAAGFVIDEVPKPSGLARLGRFLTSAPGIGLMAGIVAVGVIAAALIGGLMRGDTPGGTPGEIPGVSDTAVTSPPESEPGVTGEPEDTAEPETTEERETAEGGVIPLPGNARIAVCNGAGEMLLPDVYPLWTEVWMPGQNGAPGGMASGSGEGMPPMRELLEALRAKSIRWDADLSFVTAESYRVTGITLYDKNGVSLFDVTMDEVAVLDERTNGGVYYVELGLLYTGQYIEEAEEHEESFFEVPFCLLIGEEPEETETEPETTNLVSAAYDTLPYRNARVYGYAPVNEWAFEYPDHMKWESVDELFLVIDSMEAYEALYPREPVYDAAFFEENVLMFVYCYCPELVFAEELIDIAIIDGRFCPVLLLDRPEYVATAIGTSFVTAEVSRKDLTMPKGEVFVVIPGDRKLESYGYFRQLPLTPEERKVPVPYENAVIHRKDDAFGAWYPRYDRDHQLVVVDSYDEYMAQEPREAVYDAAFFEDHVLIFLYYHGMSYGESEYVRELTDLYALDGTLISRLTVEYTDYQLPMEDITYVTAEVRREDLPETETGEVKVKGVLVEYPR